ncbi:MAG: hypothetical protein PWR06_1235, partial [Thermoanaerobacteraceae bacterium]|nr:hypothetical protein [Thermoanaerobacteraceae bacterium]
PESKGTESEIASWLCFTESVVPNKDPKARGLKALHHPGEVLEGQDVPNKDPKARGLKEELYQRVMDRSTRVPNKDPKARGLKVFLTIRCKFQSIVPNKDPKARGLKALYLPTKDDVYL